MNPSQEWGAAISVADFGAGAELAVGDVCCFFYITNDWELGTEGSGVQANDCCDQDNPVAQLAGGVRR